MSKGESVFEKAMKITTEILKNCEGCAQCVAEKIFDEVKNNDKESNARRMAAFDVLFGRAHECEKKAKFNQSELTKLFVRDCAEAMNGFEEGNI